MVTKTKKPRKKVVAKVEDIVEELVEKVKPEPVVSKPILSKTDPVAWWDEVGSKMVGKFTDKFIVYKAKEVFGVGFDEARYTDYCKDKEPKTLFNSVMAIWQSHN